MQDYKWGRVLCVCFFCMGGWTTVFANGKISGSGCGWKTATALTPSFRSFSRYTQLLYLNYLTHTHTHTHTHRHWAVQKQPVRKEGSKGSGKGRERERERGVLGAQSIELSRDSTSFSAILTDRWETVTSGGRERQADTYTHVCDTGIRCVSWMHYCMLFHSDSWGFMVVIKKSLSSGFYHRCVKVLR